MWPKFSFKKTIIVISDQGQVIDQKMNSNYSEIQINVLDYLKFFGYIEALCAGQAEMLELMPARAKRGLSLVILG